jgi:hypothetical protein
MSGMRRREFVTLLGGAAAGGPLAARAQQAQRMRRIGVLMNLATEDPESQRRVTAFVQGLRELGWADGRNVRIETRWGASDAERNRRYAAELVALAPDVILASGTPVLVALQRETRSIPIVFTTIVDPVGAGFAERLSRPGGNATGFTLFEYAISGKWLELLKELSPDVTRVAVIRDPVITQGIGQFAAVQAVSPPFGVELIPIGVREKETETALEKICAGAERRLDCDRRIDGDPARLDHCAGGAISAAGGVPVPLSSGERRPDVVRPQYGRAISARGRLCRPHPQGREPGRVAGAAPDQVRAGDQHQDRQGARPRRAAFAARPRRRGDRIGRSCCTAYVASWHEGEVPPRLAKVGYRG